MPLIPRECKICHKVTIRLEYKSKKYQFCSILCRSQNRLKISQNLRDRFHTLYKIDSRGCWIWKKGKSSMGYGCISYDGKQQRSHRVSYLLYKGPIENGLFVCHACDIPSCVNPDHLWLGNNKENIIDMFKKKRKSNVGDNNPRATLKERQVINIKQKLKDGIKAAIIAKTYRVKKAIIDNIKVGRTWKHVEII